MNINQLPAKNLKQIFSHLHLSELIPLRAVSSLWQATIDSLCSKQKTLKIFTSTQNVIAYIDRAMELNIHRRKYLRLKPPGEDDDLIVHPTFSAECSEFLLKLFPNLTQLVVYFDVTARMESIAAFIREYDYQLTSLALFGDFYRDYSTNTLSRQLLQPICQVINTLKVLKRLDLLTDNFYDYQVQQFISKNIFSELISFSTNMNSFTILDSLTDKTRQLTLNTLQNLNAQNLNLMVEQCPQIAANLTHLTLSGIYLDYSQKEHDFMVILCKSFPQLVYCDLSFNGGTIGAKELIEITPNLVALENLTELRLQKLSLDQLSDKQQLTTILPNSSVKILHIVVRHKQYKDWPEKCTALAKLFPAAEKITFTWFNCGWEFEKQGANDDFKLVNTFESANARWPFCVRHKAKHLLYLEREYKRIASGRRKKRH